MTGEEKEQYLESVQGIILREANVRVRRNQGHGINIDKETLINSGYLGALAALQNYDKTKSQFPTYARWYIKTAMNQCLCGEVLASPAPTRGDLEFKSKISKAFNRLSYDLNRVPTDEEMANYLNVPVETYRRRLELLQSQNFSLNQEINESGDLFEEILHTKDQESAEDEWLKISDKKALAEVFDIIKKSDCPEQHKKVLLGHYKYGLSCGELSDQLKHPIDLGKARQALRRSNAYGPLTECYAQLYGIGIDESRQKLNTKILEKM